MHAPPLPLRLLRSGIAAAPKLAEEPAPAPQPRYSRPAPHASSPAPAPQGAVAGGPPPRHPPEPSDRPGRTTPCSRTTRVCQGCRNTRGAERRLHAGHGCCCLCRLWTQSRRHAGPAGTPQRGSSPQRTAACLRAPTSTLPRRGLCDSLLPRTWLLPLRASLSVSSSRERSPFSCATEACEGGRQGPQLERKLCIRAWRTSRAMHVDPHVEKTLQGPPATHPERSDLLLHHR
jgi:hypothetical protein